MKKYIAPEVEIKKFNVENIMAESGGLTVTKTDGTAVSGADASQTVEYNTLFEIN